MDRNREARRAAHMAAHPRRRHRSTSLRDSTDEDGVEGHEQQQQQQGGSRLRDRGVVMKKDRERERTSSSSRSKRRRENRVINNNNTTFNQNNNHNNNNHNRDEIGDDSSEESVNDDEDEDDDDDVDAGNGGFKMMPPAATAVLGNNNNNNNNNSNNMQHQNHHHHHHNNQQNHQQQIQHRKTFPPSAGKVFRSAAAAAPPLPAWKAAADEMIGVSVPRKARSASTKRSHEWVSGVIGTEQSHRQNSTSPAASPAQPVAPPSPSSSNLSVRKKMKANGGVGGPSNNNGNNNNNNKPRPPAAPKTSSAKSSSSNPEELEIEIAEVLYGLMTQSQAPSAVDKKETPQSNDNKQSPTPNSTSSVVAPKRKRPRQVSENPFGVRNSPPVSTSVKNETDHQNQNQNQATKNDAISAYMEQVPENGAVAAPFGFTSLPSNQGSETITRTQPPVEEEGKCVTKEEAESTSSLVGLNEGNKFAESVIMTATAAANLKAAASNPETETKKEEKFEIDLMAPPPQQRSERTSQGNDAEVEFSDRKQTTPQEISKIKEDEKVRKKEETISLAEEQKKLKAGTVQETGELSRQAVNQELRIDLEKPNKDLVSGSSNRSLHQALKQQAPPKSETHSEKTAQPSSMQMPMSVASWPPIGYVAPLQGVISMDGNTMPSAPIQPIFPHPRPKRCATHCYIARNIHYLQQFMKMNPFWPPTTGAAPMFGAKPGNLNLMPSAELHGSIPPAIQDKAQGVHIFPGHATKETKPTQATTVPDPAQRKQQILLQQTMPPVPPNNILHGPAFIFPFNQQQAAVAATASVRPGSAKLNTSTSGGLGGASGAPSSGTVSATTSAAAPALSFNYPNMSANETQYLAILQNNPYTFPIPAVGAPPNYRGNPHAQAMPLFNGSFYSSQMIHPSQIPQPSQQAPLPTQAQSHHPAQSQQISQTHQNSSGSTSSSQKHLQAQQRQQQGSGSVVNGSGSGNGGSLHNSYPASHKSRSQQPSQHMNPPPQARHLENEVTGGEDSPSTAESRASRAASTMSVYGHNYAMPVHSQNFALMNPQAAMSNAAASGNSHDKKQPLQSQQQGAKRAGAESSSLPPQTFAMSFSPMNGTTGTMSSMAQNHAIFQNMPESLRQNYQSLLGMAPSLAQSMQKKDFRVPEEASRIAGHHDSSNVADEDRKGSSGKSGQSIAFSRPDITTDASGSSPGMPGTSVIDSSSRNINLGSNNRTSRSPMPTSAANAQAQASHHLHTQFQHQQVNHQTQQQILQLQKQQQQIGSNINARLKNPPSSNGSAYPDHLITPSSSVTAKFPNSLSSFPLQTSNTSSSPVQSPQWRNSVRGPPSSQAPSSLASATTSSLKNLHQSHQSHQSHQAQQQQSSRPHQQSHTQISFGAAGQKLQSTSSSHMQPQNQNTGTNCSNQSPSPPMLVGSPTTSSLSKGGGAGGSPRTTAPASTSGRPAQASSLSSSQQVKNPPVGTTQRSSSSSILGNPHNPISTKSQQQQQQQHQKQTLQQQQQQYQAMFMSNAYLQQTQPPQSQHHSGGSNTGPGYNYMQQRKQQSSQPQNHQTTSSSMLSLSPPVTLANTTTSDPAKAIAAATSNLKGGVGLVSQQWGAAAATQSSMPAGFPQYVHNAPVPVQVKPAEQKQPAGE